MTKQLIIALGSNIEPKREYLQIAIDHLKDHFQLIKLSSIYQSEPVDYLEQDQFLNMVASFQLPDLEPKAVLELLQKIEREMKRVKFIDKGPRNIDLDIIFFGDQQYQDDQLSIPHPRWMLRDFVIYPLLELDLSPELLTLVESYTKDIAPPLKTDLKII